MSNWEFWEWVYWKNALWQWALAAGVLVAVFTGVKVLKIVSVARLRKLAATTATNVDDFLVELLNKTSKLLIFSIALRAAAATLELPAKLITSFHTFLALMCMWQAVLWGNEIIDYLIDHRLRKGDEFGRRDASLATIGPSLKFLCRLVFFIVVLLLALQNFGFDVTTLVAGLGVGGIAIALAVQRILGDLFSSLSIILDKPFIVGDSIVVGDTKGKVEKIGLKTTRLRSVSGEQLIISNSDLLNSRIQNYHRMDERRASFTVSVVYDTPLSKLKEIPKMIEKIVEGESKVRFDRAHFTTFGNSAFVFEIVYFVLSPDYNLSMDIQQRVNYAIVDKFEKEGIQFAYSSQTFILKQPA